MWKVLCSRDPNQSIFTNLSLQVLIWVSKPWNKPGGPGQCEQTKTHAFFLAFVHLVFVLRCRTVTHLIIEVSLLWNSPRWLCLVMPLIVTVTTIYSCVCLLIYFCCNTCLYCGWHWQLSVGLHLYIQVNEANSFLTVLLRRGWGDC